MINSDMRPYVFFTLGEPNTYGTQSLSETPQGKVMLSVYITSQQIQDNINYTEANYIALTHDNDINDSYVIQINDNQKAKVLYIQPKGRYKQVFLRNYD